MPTRTQSSHRHPDAHVQTTHTRLSIPTSTRKHTHAHKHTHTQTQLPTQNKQKHSYSVSETKKTDHRTNLCEITTYTHKCAHVKTHIYIQTHTYTHTLSCLQRHGSCKRDEKECEPQPTICTTRTIMFEPGFPKKEIGKSKKSRIHSNIRNSSVLLCVWMYG